MRFLSRLKIGPRIYIVVAIMTLLTAGIAWMGVDAMDRYEQRTSQMSQLTERALLSEQANVLLTQTVALTAQIYNARNSLEISEKADAMAQIIDELDTKMIFWEGLLPPEMQKSFREEIKQPLDAYFQSRRALTAAALTEGPEAARAIGDQKSIVETRQKVVASLQAAGVRNAKAVENMSHELSSFYQAQRPMMIGIAATGLVICLVLAIAIVVLTVTRPITRITGTMSKLADGDLEVAIDGAERRDEIGAMAKTVQVFKDNMVARAEAERQIEAQRQHETAEREAREARERAAIAEISELCNRIAAGDLEMRLDESNKEGFLLTMSQRLNGLAAMLQSMTGELAAVTAAMAEGDVTRTVTGDYAGVFGALKNSVNRMAATLKDLAGRLRVSAAAVRDASGEISAGSQDLAQRTESQAASIEETAASMHEITATVKQNADNAQAANQLAIAARDTAEKGGTVVADAVAAVSRIEESAQKISDIVSLIDEIAFQTNLLALNASVEAARAGEAGKGFAVVAQEVRALAQRSANASKDIKALITESNQQVKTGATLVGQTGGSLQEIVNAVKKVADIVAEIAAASREQAMGLEQINTAVASMDEMTQRNGALVEETSASAQALASQAQDLAGLVAFFRTGNETVSAAPARIANTNAAPAAARSATQPAEARKIEPSKTDKAKADKSKAEASEPEARKAAPAAKPAPAPQPKAQPAALAAPAASNTAPSFDDDDWQEF
jgi:methyl-accepting chemotaxis protein